MIRKVIQIKVRNHKLRSISDNEANDWDNSSGNPEPISPIESQFEYLFSCGIDETDNSIGGLFPSDHPIGIVTITNDSLFFLVSFELDIDPLIKGLLVHQVAHSVEKNKVIHHVTNKEIQHRNWESENEATH